MKKLIQISLLCFCFFSVSSVYAGNPFQAPCKSDTGKVKKTNPPNPIYIKLAQIQQHLSEKLSGLMKEVKDTGNFLSMLPLILIAFMYGTIHAAGPGHGKAIATSFLISRGRNIQDGLFIGSFIAMLHGLSGITLVLLLKLILNKSVMSPLADITHITKLISYSLILGVGILLILKNLYSWYLNLGVKRDSYASIDKRPAGSLSMALIVGLIPCPGTVIIMLFALSIDMIGAGVILATSHTLGMAVTISIIGMIVVALKKQTLDTLDYKRRDIAETIERLIETTASTAIVVIGALLLLNTI